MIADCHLQVRQRNLAAEWADVGIPAWLNFIGLPLVA
jgi:hypothetical protein